MRYGYVKTAAVSPDLKVADVMGNAKKIVEAAEKACEDGVKLLVLPELSICGCTCGDLLFQDTLLKGCEKALGVIADKTADMDMVIIAGLPVKRAGALFNCGAVLYNGDVLGIVPRTYTEGPGEDGGPRYFDPAPIGNDLIDLEFQKDVLFGTDVLFRMEDMSEFCFAVEVGGDICAPIPPSAMHAKAGAAIIANLAASCEAAGKAGKRKSSVKELSGRLMCGYVYAGAGSGESTTDMVFAGHDIIAENGCILSESKPFGKGWAVSEIDTQSIAFERRHSGIFPPYDDMDYDIVTFNMEVSDTELTRTYPAYPFIPEGDEKEKVCAEILEIQARALAKRMAHTGSAKAVLGISGGLDSSLALIASVRAMEILGKPASQVLAVTMPCFGTTDRTKSNAQILSEGLGAEFRTVDISETVEAHLKSIGHDMEDHSVTFENAQARARTYALMDIANKVNGLVVGTGDLSELALGWATYNGDHMSMYGVNGSVPKTLIRHILSVYAANAADAGVAGALKDILDTPVSPELLPSKDGEIVQKTEDLVGPYELHDFILYNAIGKGFGPEKIFMLMKETFCGKYDNETLLKWLKNFYRRFFSQQFKRSCMPDGPQASVISLSPRGGLRMPSDAVSALWMDEIDKLS